MSEESVEVRARRPVAKFAAGSVSIAIWKNRRETDGRAWDAFSAQIQNRYLDEASGEWRDSEYFSPSSLADLMLVTLRALQTMRVQERKTGPDGGAAEASPF